MDFGAGVKKSLNLLPIEYKKKEATRLYIMVGLWVVAILSLVVMVFGGRMWLAKMQLTKANNGLNEIKSVNSQITALEKSIKEKEAKLIASDDTYFAFDSFMTAIYEYKPSSVTIISLDSQDRLVTTSSKGNVGNTSDTASENTNTGEKDAPATAAKKAADDNVKAAEAKKEDTSNSNESSGNTSGNTSGDTKGNTNSTGAENSSLPEGYKKVTSIQTTPLTQKSIFLRGYSTSADDIANYIYKLTYVDCIKNVQLTSIEERIDGNNKKTKVFELVISTKG